METTKPSIRILKILLKDLTLDHTTTSLAEETAMSRVGAWKTLKKMQADNLVLFSPIGIGKTGVRIIRLNWSNLLVEKTLALALTEDALNNQRWRSNFAELESKVDFLIIYGSILHSPKEANDIDILGIVSNSNKFLEIEEAVKNIQKTQIKKIHIISFTQTEFREEIERRNKVFLDAIKKGVILFGQEKFIKFMKSVRGK